MLCTHHSRRPHTPSRAAWGAAFVLASLLTPATLHAQGATPRTPADIPASLPAGVLAAPPPAAEKPAPAPKYPQISAKQARDADDAYIEGAKQVQRKDFAAAIKNFERAVQLNPGNRDYTLALIVTHENRVTELIQLAAKARLSGDNTRADALLEQARALDPDNRLVTQHLGVDASPLPKTTVDRAAQRANALSASLGGPIELEPTTTPRSFHTQADPRSLLRTIYQAYGISTTFDSTVASSGNIAIDVDNVNFEEATRIILQLTHSFAVPVQGKQVLLFKDGPENRQEFLPQIEETVYLPGYSQEQMTEFATIARNIFDLKQVTASSSSGFILLRGDEESLRLLNATYADMIDGGTDVLFDVNLYEINTSKTRSGGTTLPASIGAFDLVNSAQTLLNNNQTLISQAVANGLLTLGTDPLKNLIAELGVLAAAGVDGTSQFTNLLGYVGTYGGLPLVGVSVLAGTNFAASLNTSDSRLLDSVQIRTGNGQATNFRAGSRYPIETAQYSSGINSSLASQLSGLNINGTSASALLKQYLGSTQTSVPQFQFEDLGITLKLTPHVQHGSDVNLILDMKIEALGGTSINSIPILNNRALTSTITLPEGQTAMLAALVSRNELSSIAGLPGISELPGFQGTEKSKETDTDELLITITPHIVRSGGIRIASKRLAAIHTTPQQ
jgi:general secretion pathway protein D